MQLVLSNAQGELPPLERGMHALAATRNGKRHDEYAKQCGVAKNTITQWIQAAELAEVVEVSQYTLAEPAPITQALSSYIRTGERPDHLMRVLAKRTYQLMAIHAAPARVLAGARGAARRAQVDGRADEGCGRGGQPPGAWSRMACAGLVGQNNPSAALISEPILKPGRP